LKKGTGTNGTADASDSADDRAIECDDTQSDTYAWRGLARLDMWELQRGIIDANRQIESFRAAALVETRALAGLDAGQREAQFAASAEKFQAADRSFEASLAIRRSLAHGWARCQLDYARNALSEGGLLAARSDARAGERLDEARRRARAAQTELARLLERLGGG
jgi:hypothetical protein